LVGIGQGVARDLAAKTHVVKLGRAMRRQTWMSRRLSRKVNWAKAMHRYWSQQEKLLTL
jgi:hypothetical protein